MPEIFDVSKARNPEDPVVSRAFNVSVGKKLDPFNWFCRDNGLPSLTCLAGDAKGKPGLGYMRNNNWKAEQVVLATQSGNGCAMQFKQKRLMRMVELSVIHDLMPLSALRLRWLPLISKVSAVFR